MKQEFNTGDIISSHQQTSLKYFLVFLRPSSKSSQKYLLSHATTASFHVFYKSLFTIILSLDAVCLSYLQWGQRNTKNALRN